MMAIAWHKGIRPVLVITKSDLGKPDWLEEIYGTVGLAIFVVSNQSGEGIGTVRAQLAHGVSAFSGNSGVGKSSLLNRIDGRLSIETGETSQKLGRGRHTTRHVELYAVGQDGYIAGYAGFSAVDIRTLRDNPEGGTAGCFPSLPRLSGFDRIYGCSHTVEKGCAVLEAVNNGIIHPSRHNKLLCLL